MRSEQAGGPGLLGPLLLLLCCGDAGLQHTSATAAYGRAPLLVRVLASHEVAAAVALKRRPDLRGGGGDASACASSTPEPAGAYNETEVLRRADCLRKEDNRPAEALELYREVIWRGNSRNADALGGAAAVLIARQSTLGEARDLLERALRVAPTDARILHGLGMTEWTASRNATAAAPFFARAMRLDPSHARSRCALANMLEEQGETQQADEMMREALEALPSQPDIANDYGALLAERTNANLTQAEALFRRAVHLAPKSVAPVYNHAQLKLQRDDLDGAEPLLRQAFALQALNRTPDTQHNTQHNTRTLSSLAHLAEQRGNRPAARRLLERALALDPSCGMAYLQLADLTQDDDSALSPECGDAHASTLHPSPEAGGGGARKLTRVCELYSKAVEACVDASPVDHAGAWGAAPLVIAA